MAFWGVEVKPGKTFTLKHGDLDGKLILTQATLGIGSSEKKSILQCNVGDNAPVFLCSLLPDKLECCSLNLEFEEEDDVKFSVVGPTSIHLSGFVQGDHQCLDRDDSDSDSYGEDIAETETEDSDYDSEDDYEDDFIDDDDMSMFPPSPVPNSGVVIEEIIDDEKDASEKGGTKQPKKKNQLADCDKSEKQIIVKGKTDDLMLQSEDEDGFPVPSSVKTEPSSGDKTNTENKPAGEGKKKKKKNNDAKDDSAGAKSLKRKVDTIDHDEEQTRRDNEETSAAEVVPVENPNQKKKKKKKGKSPETDGNPDNAVDKDANPSEASKSKDVQKLNSGSFATGLVVNGDVSEQKKKKKKKKGKNAEKAEGLGNTEQDVSTEDKNTSTAEKGAKQSKAKPAKVRTFPNGLVIEELQMGKPDGKRASRGSKVSVRYVGKLQKTGKQFDANIGRSPFKFRLGVGAVIKGWDVGVEGMRVGDKRRLVIPPSMGYGSSGAPPSIPPNAWLVFDVELVNVA